MRGEGCGDEGCGERGRGDEGAKMRSVDQVGMRMSRCEGWGKQE